MLLKRCHSYFVIVMKSIGENAGSGSLTSERLVTEQTEASLSCRTTLSDTETLPSKVQDGFLELAFGLMWDTAGDICVVFLTSCWSDCASLWL